MKQDRRHAAVAVEYGAQSVEPHKSMTERKGLSPFLSVGDVAPEFGALGADPTVANSNWCRGDEFRALSAEREGRHIAIEDCDWRAAEREVAHFGNPVVHARRRGGDWSSWRSLLRHELRKQLEGLRELALKGHDAGSCGSADRGIGSHDVLPLDVEVVANAMS